MPDTSRGGLGADGQQYVTERRQAEEAFRESEELFRSLFEFAPEFIYVLDKRGTILKTNSITVTSLGYSEKEMVGQHMNRFFTSASQEIFAKEFPALMEKGTCRHEMELVCKDGRVINVDCLARAVRDERGDITSFVVHQRDITEYLRTAEALKQKITEINSLINNLPDMAWLKDADSHFIAVNKAFGEAVGVDPEDLVGHSCEVCFGEEAVEKFREDDLKVMKGKRQVVFEEKIADAQGNEIWLETVKSPIMNESGEVVGTVGVARDITERKLAEQQLLAYQDQLRSLAAELSIAEDRERRRIAVELHDEVAQTLGMTKVDLEKLQAPARGTAFAKPLGDIYETVDQVLHRLGSLTFQISPPVLYELGFEPAVEWLVEQFQEEHGISTKFKSDEHSTLPGDEVAALLFQAVRELLMNIAKHAQASKVNVSVQRHSGMTRVVVEDDGVGFNVSGTLALTGKIAGYGLFSIRERLSHFGGSLEVESQPGRGTRAMMTVPLKHRKKEANARTHGH